MVQIPLNIINKEIDLLGELVTITAKSGRTYSDWGDETATETDTTKVKALYNVYSERGDTETEGKFQSAKITFFFKSPQSGIVNGNKITRANGEEFSIRDARDHGVQGNTYVIEALVENI